MIAHALHRAAQTPKAFSNWLSMLLKLATGNLFSRPETVTFHTRSGLRVSCPNRPGARVPVYEVFAEDCYRLDWFFGGSLSAPLRVLDIGAHVGSFAIALAHLDPAATVHCFEPSAATADFLRRNVSDNHLDARIAVRQEAVADVTGEVSFLDNGVGSAQNSMHASAALPGSQRGTVMASTLDDVVAADGPFDVVKLDCEGAEYDIVFAAGDESWSTVRFLVLEYHPSSSRSWNDLENHFTRLGFNVAAVEAVSPDQGTAWLRRLSPAA